MIEGARSTVNLLEKRSVQEIIDQFIRGYNEAVEKPFSHDMFKPESLLGLILHECENKPNS